jgi:adenine-specific DNA methylase
LRVLDEIRATAAGLVQPGADVADLFAGTTVVAQAFATDGYTVTAVDTQAYSETFGRALLGIERSEDEIDHLAELAREIDGQPAKKAPGVWRSALEREDDAVNSGDATALQDLYDSLPLYWRPGGSKAEPPSITTVYAGTYFGVRQALTLDQLHRIASEQPTENQLSTWQVAATKTALMFAASLAVHSAGKHFAQPLKASSTNAQFIKNRLLSDRKENISVHFIEGCRRVSASPFRAIDGHRVVMGEAEQAIGLIGSKQLYYVDPPYTAQQYSRFYHVLETLANDGVPKLPTNAPTSSGLYPEKRYKSAFSSRSKAPAALAGLINVIAGQGAAALISYSTSAASSYGNARMISLTELLDMCNNAFGRHKVECVSMQHRYRQFNSVKNANAKRDDREILLICRSV